MGKPAVALLALASLFSSGCCCCGPQTYCFSWCLPTCRPVCSQPCGPTMAPAMYAAPPMVQSAPGCGCGPSGPIGAYP